MEKNKKISSFFNNNLDKIDPNVLKQIKIQLDLLEKRVKLLENEIKKVKNEQS